MNGNYYYEWGISWSLPAGDQITSATLTYNNIQLTSFGKNNPGLLWTHLLNSATAGVTTETDNDKGSDAFGVSVTGKNLFLGKQTFPTLNQTRSFSYNLDLTTLSSYLADGKFGIGIDPDCVFKDSSIVLCINYGPTGGQSVPDGGATAILFGATMVGLGWISRKMRS
jgi:hypothetical protein